LFTQRGSAIKNYPLALGTSLHYLVKLQNYNFNGILHVKPQNSSCKI